MAYTNMDPATAHWMQPAPPLAPQMHHHQQQQQQHQQQQNTIPSSTLPFILQLSDQTTASQPIEIASLEMREMETQTIPPWSELLRLTIQNYLAHWLKQLLDKNVKGNTCVHMRGITLEEIMAIVVERHNALCVEPEVVAKKQSEVVQIPIEQYSETEAAATAMVDLLNEMQQQEFQAEFNEPLATHDDDDDWSNTGTQPSGSKKVARKRPAESTKEELLRKGVKIIRCDPPEHIQQQAQQVWQTKDTKGSKRRHIPPKQWFQCETCGQKLRDISKLARHASTHTEIRLHWCTKCSKRYKSRDQLTKHVREVHTKTRVKQFKMFCPYCGKGFHDRERRDDHISVHTGESRYKCQNCDKAFRSRKALHMHTVIKHETEKSVKCPLCDCIFPAHSYLGKHLLSAHKAQISQKVKAVFVNKCLTCNTEFDTEQILYQHVELTHGRDCEPCRRRERTKENHIQYAVNCGMNPDEATAKPLEELKEFIKVDKKRREEERAEKKAKENRLIANKAILLGMDREAAQDPVAAAKYIKEKKKEKQQKDIKKRRKRLSPVRPGQVVIKKESVLSDSDDDDYEPGEFNMDEEAGDIDANLNPQLLVAKENQQLRTEVEELRNRINKNAMELALDIVEELDAKDVFRTGIVNQEMAVIKAELEVRNKKGNQQKSLAQKIVELPASKNKPLNRTVTVVQKKQVTKSPMKSKSSESSKKSPKSDKSAAKSGQKVEEVESETPLHIDDDKVTIKATGRSIVPPKILSVEQTASAPDANSCIVYSQSPGTTMGMIKKGMITYVFVRSDSAKIFATHMHSKPTQVNSPFSCKMFVNSIDPAGTKDKLLGGTLKMKIVPILVKPEWAEVKPSGKAADKISKSVINQRSPPVKGEKSSPVGGQRSGMSLRSKTVKKSKSSVKELPPPVARNTKHNTRYKGKFVKKSELTKLQERNSCESESQESTGRKEVPGSKASDASSTAPAHDRSNTGSTASKVAQKRPAESIKEELMNEDIKIIRLDPSEHIQHQAQNETSSQPDQHASIHDSTAPAPDTNIVPVPMSISRATAVDTRPSDHTAGMALSSIAQVGDTTLSHHAPGTAPSSIAPEDDTTLSHHTSVMAPSVTIDISIASAGDDIRPSHHTSDMAPSVPFGISTTQVDSTHPSHPISVMTPSVPIRAPGDDTHSSHHTPSTAPLVESNQNTGDAQIASSSDKDVEVMEALQALSAGGSIEMVEDTRPSEAGPVLQQEYVEVNLQTSNIQPNQ